MNDIETAKGAWLVEAMGEFARLLDRVEALIAALAESTDAQCAALDRLDERLAGFDRRMSAITEHAKTETVKYLAAKTDEAARRLIIRQRSEMADAVRGVFGAALDTRLLRLQATVERLAEHSQRRWEPWLTHAAAAAAGSAVTLAIQAAPWR